MSERLGRGAVLTLACWPSLQPQGPPRILPIPSLGIRHPLFFSLFLLRVERSVILTKTGYFREPKGSVPDGSQALQIIAPPLLRNEARTNMANIACLLSIRHLALSSSRTRIVPLREPTKHLGGDKREGV